MNTVENIPSLQSEAIPERMKHVFEFYHVSEQERIQSLESNKNISLNFILPECAVCKECVYIIQAGPYVKIGITYDVDKRVKELQCGNPHKLEVLKVFPTKNAKQDEDHLHRRLAKYRKSGEWFELPSEWIENLIFIRRISDLPKWIDEDQL